MRIVKVVRQPANEGGVPYGGKPAKSRVPRASAVGKCCPLRLPPIAKLGSRLSQVS